MGCISLVLHAVIGNGKSCAIRLFLPDMPHKQND